MLTQSRFQLGPLTLQVDHDQAAIYGCTVTIDTVTTGDCASAPGEGDACNDLRMRIQAQLLAYLEHRHATFDLPLVSAGSDFQARVWEQLKQIPAGQTLTYGQLASRLQTAAQPVGGACKRNPIGFFVPCHRVVAAQAIGGYAGTWGEGPNIDVKRWLLNHEKGFSHASH